MNFPAGSERLCLIKYLVDDLSSYSISNPKTHGLLQVVCAVCDGIPPEVNWHMLVPIQEVCALLAHFMVYEGNDLIVCTTRVLKGLTEEANKNIYLFVGWQVRGRKEWVSYRNRLPPFNTVDLRSLPEAEAYIRGWHTFCTGPASATVADLVKVSDAVKESILAVLAGPIITQRKALAVEATSVDPPKVVAAFRWLVNNNVRYREEQIPHSGQKPNGPRPFAGLLARCLATEKQRRGSLHEHLLVLLEKPERILATADTRLNIIDEISFAAPGKIVEVMSSHLKRFRDGYKRQYGTLSMASLGCFRQLQTVGADCIHKHKNVIYREASHNKGAEAKMLFAVKPVHGQSLRETCLYIFFLVYDATFSDEMIPWRNKLLCGFV